MELIEKVAMQVPALAVLAFIVRAFLKTMSERQAELLKTFDEIHREHLDAREQDREIIKRNTEAFEKFQSALVSCPMREQ